MLLEHPADVLVARDLPATLRLTITNTNKYTTTSTCTNTSTNTTLMCRCEARGDPQPTITWLKDGKQVIFPQRCLALLTHRGLHMYVSFISGDDCSNGPKLPPCASSSRPPLLPQSSSWQARGRSGHLLVQVREFPENISFRDFKQISFSELQMWTAQ